MRHLIRFSLIIASVIAISSYGMDIFDAAGKKIKTVADTDNLEGMAQNLRKNNPSNRYYFRTSSKSEKNYPAAPSPILVYEKTQYIETDKEKKYRVCLENDGKGFWEGSIPFALSKENCLLLSTPNRTGSFLFVYFSDSIPSDSIWLLNNQKLIDLSKDTHMLWSIDSIVGPFNRRSVYGSYKATHLNKILVVDRTEATIGEVKYLCDYFGTACKLRNPWSSNDSLDNHPNKPQAPLFSTVPDYANNRSRLEGFEISSRANGADTLKNGYRLPTHDEWVALQRGGSSKDYYWGNETDSATISQYEWYKSRTERVHEVGLLKPNPYGLYDVMGNATESLLFLSRECLSRDEISRECSMKRSFYQQGYFDGCYYQYSNGFKNPPVKKCEPFYAPKYESFGFRLVRELFIDK